MKKIKVLYFVDRMLRGGIQTFVLENWKHMNHEEIQIDFLLLDDGNHYELEDTLKKTGSKVYKLKNIWLNHMWDYIAYLKALDNFFRRHNDYEAIHLHSGSKNFVVLSMAKKYGIKVRIAHSHSIDFQTISKIKKIAGNFFKIFLQIYATDYFGCSYEAGCWLFGKKIADNQFHVIHNAVDTEKFFYKKELSENAKSVLNLSDKYVIGHVGRFCNQKNHSFLIEIFKEIHKKRADAKLLLVGTGELEEEIKNMVKQYQLTDDVIFAGFHENVEFYMQAMDAFVFPSKCEGLGLVLIEAQAAGLPCFTSKNLVPKESKVSNLVKFIPLQNNPEKWAEVIMNTEVQRNSPVEDIKKHGYDINDTADFLVSFYKKRALEVKK